MAKKTGRRAVYREAVNHNRDRQTLPDEITLRDEILELKRQVMVLRRTNEQYLVKLRKYEDESKRKDKQLEQLLDPRKNADVTKVLSTKGAAILMNLKDQNNSLIQMILNKDLHIRRLVAELKMSKLYASTRKNETYRAEIARLRNLLIKSQETLKENADVQQRTKSVCVSGNSVLEFSSSSDQSSPRDLDELRMTILSLETHIQRSNDLLARKNQEISHLTDELNTLRKFFRYKAYKNKTLNRELQSHYISTPDFTCKCPESLTRAASQHVLNGFEKNRQGENLPHSAPAAPTKWLSPTHSASEHTSQSTELGEENQTEGSAVLKNKENSEKLNKTVPALGDSLFHNIPTEEIPKQEKILSNPGKTVYAKDIWRRALRKFKELKKTKPEMFTEYDRKEENENEITTEFLSVEATKNVTESCRRNPENFLQEFDGSGLFKRKTDENEGSIAPNSGSGSVSENESTSELCQNWAKNSNKEESFETEKSISKEEEEHVKAETQEFFESFQEVWNREEPESKRAKSLREVYRQSLDSSFDSESSCSVRQLQVEVQINSFSVQTDSDQSEGSISENNQKSESGIRGGENCVTDSDFNDDDDVIVREK